MASYPPTTSTLYPVPRLALHPVPRPAVYPPSSPAIYPTRTHHALLVPELLDYIISLVQDSWTLKQFALVNTSWLALVRPRLFARVVINSEERLIQVLEAFGQSNWLPDVVHELECGPGVKISRAAQEACDARWLRRLKNVHTLRWIGLDWEALATRPENRDAMLTLFSRVKTLKLQNVSRNTPQVLDFLGAFPVLEDLHLGGVSNWDIVARQNPGANLRPGTHRIAPRARLRSMALDWNNTIQPTLWQGLLSTIDFSGIREVKAEHCEKQVTEFMKYLCKEGNESLETINVNVNFKHIAHCKSK
jgi:hypothetical protein